MKKVLKFFPAALALISLASCSSDDLFGDSQAEVSSEYTMLVDLEEGADIETVGDITRAGMINNVGKKWNSVWQAKDLIRAYDNTLGNYDEYKIADNAEPALKATFGLVGETPTLASHTYAVFPGDFVKTLGWGKVADAKKPILTVDIPATGISFNTNFGAKATYEGNDYPIAVTYVPTWGEVTEEGEKTAKVSLNFMSAALQVSLKAIPATASELVVYTPAGEPLAGRFEAALDAEDLANSTLKSDADKYKYSNKLTVSMTGSGLAGKSGAIILPLIAQDYKNIIILAKVGGSYQVLGNYGYQYTVAATPSADDAAFGFVANQVIASTTPAAWIVASGTDAGKYITSIRKENEVVANTTHFTLKRKQMVIFEKQFSISAICAYPSNVTEALALYSEADKLTLDIDNTGAVEYSAANYKVEIPAALSTADITLNFTKGIKEAATVHDLVFEGTCKSLTVNIKSITKVGGTIATGLDFSGLKGDVTVSGDVAENADAIEPLTLVAPAPTAANGYTFTYGKLLTAAAFTPNKCKVVVPTGATLALALGAIGDANYIAGDVDIKGTTTGAIFTNGAVTVSGAANAINAKTGAVNITGTSGNIVTTSGAITINPATKAAIASTVTTATGEVTIDNKGYTITSVTKTGAGNINLNNGIISALIFTGKAKADVVTVTSKGQSEIAGVTATDDEKANVTFNSIWDKSAAAATTAVTNIYTASQLAKAVTADATLLTNVTIVNSGSNKKDWAPVALAHNFTAPGVKISGLNQPLFTEISADVTDVTIENAAIAKVKGENGVGILAKTVSGDATFTKIKITGSSIASDTNEPLHYAGGLIGKITDGNVVVGGAAEGTEVSVGVTFTNNGKLYGASGRDKFAGTIGQIIGSNMGDDKVTLYANCTATGAFNKADAALKFSNLRKFNEDSEITGYFKGASNLIGNSYDVATPAATSDDVTIGATVYKKTPAYASLTWNEETLTVSGTIYVIDEVAEATAKAAIKAALFNTISDDNYKKVKWNQQIKALNEYVATAAAVQ